MIIASKPAETNPFEEVNLFLDRAFDRLGLDDGMRELLRRPWRELTVSVPVRMDDGCLWSYPRLYPGDCYREAS